MTYVTLHVQKDGRINLGTAVHISLNCPAIKEREVHHIDGAIVRSLPKCKLCHDIEFVRRSNHGTSLRST